MDAQRTLLVATRKGLFTISPGRSFQTLDRGLAAENAYDLFYRHALDVDTDGDTLAIGSTTGSLYVSANGGDDWQCLAEHLPPVHAVRFAPAGIAAPGAGTAGSVAVVR